MPNDCPLFWIEKVKKYPKFGTQKSLSCLRNLSSYPFFKSLTICLFMHTLVNSHDEADFNSFHCKFGSLSEELLPLLLHTIRSLNYCVARHSNVRQRSLPFFNLKVVSARGEAEGRRPYFCSS